MDVQERFLPLLPAYKYFSNHVHLQFFLKFILVVVVASPFFSTSKTFLLVHSSHVFVSLLMHCQIEERCCFCSCFFFLSRTLASSFTNSCDENRLSRKMV